MTRPRHDLLGTLSRLGHTNVFIGTLVLALLGLFLPSPYGPLLLYVTVAALAALLSLTWVVTLPVLRLVRLVVLAGLAAIATMRLLG
jgi:hypothetical protein